ncbi:hypothetical protein [Methylobacterium sp. J-090]|uniref:hypothetical protein n=1 Tax=Methylobacterium sp. J-090 TaxID=2836666 RepID=UPI001FB9A98F|nr:hypothetical protein [Methylobacterium sp. J-090]MCJ2079876.1 hypothetical protein [Methylobacterium sp. J-090]
MSAAPKIIPADAQAWRQSFLNLRPSVSPCPGLTGTNWTAVHARGLDFLERWADEAITLGWTTLDVWGVHPQIGTIRADYCGGMTMGTALVTGITENRIFSGYATFYRDTPGRPTGAVPIWLFGR